MDIAAFIAAGALLALSAFFGMRFYPPGEGYAEERRNGRISLLLLILAVLVAGAAIGLSYPS